MRIRQITTIAAAMIGIAISFGGAVAPASAAVRPASFGATDDGYGPTLAAAEHNARITLLGDYGPCSNVVVIADSQLSDGTWWAEVAGSCSFFH